jgi:hypothetical protein
MMQLPELARLRSITAPSNQPILCAFTRYAFFAHVRRKSFRDRQPKRRRSSLGARQSLAAVRSQVELGNERHTAGLKPAARCPLFPDH